MNMVDVVALLQAMIKKYFDYGRWFDKSTPNVFMFF